MGELRPVFKRTAPFCNSHHTFLLPPTQVVQAYERAYIPEAAPGNCQGLTVPAGVLRETVRLNKPKNG